MTALMAASVDGLTRWQPKNVASSEVLSSSSVPRAERVLRLGTLERSGGVDLAGCDAECLEEEDGLRHVLLGVQPRGTRLVGRVALVFEERVHVFVIKKRLTALSSSREVTSSVMPTMSKPASSAVVGGVAIARIVDEGVTVRQ